jgi:kynurenine formamidase
MDAPFHFSEDGWKVGDIPLERLFVPGEYRIKNKKEFLN